MSDTFVLIYETAPVCTISHKQLRFELILPVVTVWISV